MIRAQLVLTLLAMLVAPAAGSPTAAHEPIRHRSVADPSAAGAAQQLTLRYDRFTLPNGLRVVVHTDRKAPVVTVNVRYAVGARNEPPQRSGFAHLFEHLMFAGSDNAPGDFFAKMRDIGASGVNGGTTYEGTSFFETVPTGSLERALYYEADRMANMDRTIDQSVLDRNRGIVQNEKRQTEDQPGGLGQAQALTRLFPQGHPYGHTLLGSMDALNAATVEDARAWHRRYYTPRNAVLSLAGDIDVATARRLVERYFGPLNGGTPIPVPNVPIPQLSRPQSDTIVDQVPQLRVTRHWVTPGYAHPDEPALDMAAKILGTLTGAWLDKALIRDAPVATSLMTTSGAFAHVGTFVVSYTLAPGAVPARAAARLDAVLDRFLRTGPTAQEIKRVAMRDVGFQSRTQEPTAGQASLLAEGEALARDPTMTWRLLTAEAALTPAQVRSAARRWLSRPSYTLLVRPGNRPSAVEPVRPVPTAPFPAAPSPAAAAPARAAPSSASGVAMPAIRPTPAARFPQISRFRLTNGIVVVAARRPEVAITRVAMTFDGAAAADAAGESGAQGLMFAMVKEGGRGRDGAPLAAALDRLGADLWFETGIDQSVGTLTVPTVRAPGAFALFAGLLRHPRFDGATLDRVVRLRQALIAQEWTDPAAIAQRRMMPLLYGATSAYGRASATGSTQDVAALTPARLTALAQAWLRPDKARLYVVSDLPPGRLSALLERTFGTWRAEGEPGATGRLVDAPAPPQIVVVNRPGSAQSYILGATRAALQPGADADDVFAALAGQEAIGGFRGRINDDLRERNGWSYGAGGGYAIRRASIDFTARASVQADKTALALTHIRDMIHGYATAQPITAAEWSLTLKRATSTAAGRYESGDAVLNAIRVDDLAGRPDDFEAKRAARLLKLTVGEIAQATRQALSSRELTWVVVGDAAAIGRQLEIRPDLP